METDVNHNEGLSPARCNIDIGDSIVKASEITAIAKSINTRGALPDYDKVHNAGLMVAVTTGVVTHFGTRQYECVVADWHEWLRAMDKHENQGFAERYKSLIDEIGKSDPQSPAEILDELNKRD